MKFGFLLDEKEFSSDNFSIEKVDNFSSIRDSFYESDCVSDGFVYGPTEELKHTKYEKKYFKQSPPEVHKDFFDIEATHILKTESHDIEYLNFMVLGYGFLQGIYLKPENLYYLNSRVAYKPSKYHGVILSANDHAIGMQAFHDFFHKNPTENVNQMYACIHWFLLSQASNHDWEIFEAQYKVLDGIYRLSGLKAPNHAKRPIILAKEHNLKLPEWAKVKPREKNSQISHDRNTLFHEAKFGGKPIGFSNPEENYSLELYAFNTKLIAATLGLRSEYLSADPSSRHIMAWDFI